MSMKIDFSKLLGFDMMSRELSASVGSQGAFDFRNDTMASKLGAKASVEPRPIKRPTNNPGGRVGELRDSTEDVWSEPLGRSAAN
jgi:hypothetical protein